MSANTSLYASLSFLDWETKLPGHSFIFGLGQGDNL
jgi:hypothetical protein